MKPRPPLERDVQRRVVALLKSAGFTVYSLSQGYRPGGRGHGTTRQTKGLPDLYAMSPRLFLWVEVKRLGGKQTPEQVEFEADCRACGIPYVLGGYREVLEWLIARDVWRLPPGVTLDDVAPDA